MAHAVRFAPRRVLRATARLNIDPNPSLSRPAIVKVRLDVSGRLVRSHVAAGLMREAIDLAVHRLQRQLADVASARRSRTRHTGMSEPGEWRHGDLPEYQPRQNEHPVVVRHKTPTLPEMTPERAVSEMTLLDYDFLLFSTPQGLGEAVVYRATERESHVRLIPPAGCDEELAGHLPADAPPTVMSLDAATALLGQSGNTFVFFVDDHSGRGTIAYRRYDGHYGVISPSVER